MLRRRDLIGANAVLLLAGLALHDAPAQQIVDTTGATTCDTRGFSLDRDPNGTNIRRAPRADAPVIGRLLPRDYHEHDRKSGVVVGQEFRIVGSKDGWLLISDVEPEADRQGRLSDAFAGPGWVSGALVGAQLGALTLRAAPRHDAPVLARMAGDGWGPSSVGVKGVHGCLDKYIDVTVVPPNGKPLRGWSWKPCSSQLTTCDRSDSDLDN